MALKNEKCPHTKKCFEFEGNHSKRFDRNQLSLSIAHGNVSCAKTHQSSSPGLCDFITDYSDNFVCADFELLSSKAKWYEIKVSSVYYILTVRPF